MVNIFGLGSQQVEELWLVSAHCQGMFIKIGRGLLIGKRMSLIQFTPGIQRKTLCLAFKVLVH